MKRLLSIFLALAIAVPAFAADAANDIILTQRKADNSGNIQRNVAPAAGGLLAFDGSKIPGSIPLGTGVATALGANVGSAGAPVILNGAGGTPSSIVLTNATGAAAGLTAGTASAVAASGITGTTLASNVVTSSLTGVGALTSGSIGSGFGSINVGANSITGGAISGTTGTFTKATAGDSIVVTNGAAANKTGYLGTDAIYLYLTSGTYLTGNGIYMDNVANTVGFQTSGIARALITSTGLNNTVIGATTAAAGSFTTLGASGDITTTGGGFIGVANTYNLIAGAEGLVYGGATTAILRAPSGTANLRVGNTDIASASSTGLAVTGNLTGSGVYTNTTASAANVFVDSAGLLYRSTSSIRYKRDVKPYAHGLAEVNKLRPVFYKGNAKADGDTQFAGLIAEEVDALGLKEFVEYADSVTETTDAKTGIKSKVYTKTTQPEALRYQNMVTLLIKALQEEDAKVDRLESRLAALEAKP